MVGIASAIVHPIDTYNGLVNSCQAGFAQYGGNGPSFEGLLQCVDNLNPIAGIRNYFSTSLSATNVQDSGQAFGAGLLGVALTAAPFAKGILPPSANCGTAVVTAKEAADLVRTAQPVCSALTADAWHRSASFVVGDIAQKGTVSRTVGADSVSRIMIQMPGEVNGVAGRFEWIVGGGKLTHQMFERGGTINGIPIKP